MLSKGCQMIMLWNRCRNTKCKYGRLPHTIHYFAGSEFVIGNCWYLVIIYQILQLSDSESSSCNLSRKFHWYEIYAELSFIFREGNYFSIKPNIFWVLQIRIYNRHVVQQKFPNVGFVLSPNKPTQKGLSIFIWSLIS